MVSYRVEYASTGRAKCVGPICSKLAPKANIAKGEMRFGTWVEISTGQFESKGFKWRHYDKILKNIQKEFKSIDDELDGFEELTSEDAERLKKAVEVGQLEEADATPDTRPPKPSKNADKEENPASSPTADKQASEPEATPKKTTPKKAPTKRKPKAKKEQSEDDAGSEVIPTDTKKRAAPKRKTTKKAKAKTPSSEEEEEEAESSEPELSESELSALETEEEEEEKPQKKQKKAAPKKATAKKTATKAAAKKKRAPVKSKAEVDSDDE